MSEKGPNPYAAPKPVMDGDEVGFPTTEVGINRQRFSAYMFSLLAATGITLWLLDSFVPLDEVHFIVPMSLSISGYLALFVILSSRFENIGWNRWLGLQVVIPLVNVVALIVCLVLPPNYATTKRIDQQGVVMIVVLVGSLLLAGVLSLAYFSIGR